MPQCEPLKALELGRGRQPSRRWIPRWASWSSMAVATPLLPLRSAGRILRCGRGPMTRAPRARKSIAKDSKVRILPSGDADITALVLDIGATARHTSVRPVRNGTAQYPAPRSRGPLPTAGCRSLPPARPFAGLQPGRCRPPRHPRDQHAPGGRRCTSSSAMDSSAR